MSLRRAGGNKPEIHLFNEDGDVQSLLGMFRRRPRRLPWSFEPQMSVGGKPAEPNQL